MAATASRAQNGEAKPPDQAKPAADAGKDGKEATPRGDDDAGRLLTGPAANAECLWLGERAVQLMYRDDLDTAFRHLDLYDRFGCPGGQIQVGFRCVLRQGNIDQKVIKDVVHACWINPATVPPPAATAEKAAPK